MKRTYSIAVAFGCAVASLGALPVVTPAAVAQAVSESMEERQLQAQIIALAQAGNTAGIQQLVGIKLAQGKGAMVAKVAKSIAAMGQSLASSDTQSSAALINVALTLANNPAVAAADNTLVDAVGEAAANAAYAMTATDPASSANIQSFVASINNGPLQMAYMNANVGGGSNTQTVQTAQNTQQATQQNTTTVVRVVPQPVTPEVPVIVEPNPDQSGSPT
ncbi:hypothetical protein [Gimibacter soli]|uniref:Uncharacterized protein n=1 Tax=Gimibacter soli TaxID=3024400 RepID=A0AAF0BGD9_9PROT|nr:hypothetical protein [Gimibacter soli]WCL53383.1 hypothetical protein PH603_12625 [Gimibacter soli]